MNLSSFYNQVCQDHAKAVKGLRDSQKMPHQRQYKSIKAISSSPDHVRIYSWLGNVSIETIYNLKFIFSKNKVKYWRYILKINIYQAKILSLFTKYTNYCFFWDFNYDHYALFLGGYIGGSNLVGSMHNYHYIKIFLLQCRYQSLEDFYD